MANQPLFLFKHAPSDSWLGRLLSQTTTEIETDRILSSIRWDEPIARISFLWQRSESIQEGHLGFIHPLSAIIQTNNRSLIDKALQLANQAPQSSVRFENLKDLPAMADWIQSGVLKTAVCRSDADVVQTVLSFIQERPFLTPTLTANGDIPGNPWKALAADCDFQRSTTDIQNILKKLDNYSRENSPFIFHKPPQQRRTWNKLEKDIRKHNHEITLREAAKAGNSPVVHAVLGLGYAQPNAAVFIEALESRHATLAQAICQRIQAGELIKKTNIEPVWRALEHINHTWQRPSWTPPEIAGAECPTSIECSEAFILEQQTACQALTVALVGQMVGLNWENDSLNWPLERMVYSLQSLDEIQAEKAAELLAEHMDPRVSSWTDPSLNEWLALVENDGLQSPWAKLRLQQIALYSSEKANDYWCRLTQDLRHLWAKGEDPLLAYDAAVFHLLWPLLRPETPFSMAWADAQRDALVRNPTPEALLALQQRWLNVFLPEAAAPSAPRVRL